MSAVGLCAEKRDFKHNALFAVLVTYFFFCFFFHTKFTTNLNGSIFLMNTLFLELLYKKYVCWKKSWFIQFNFKSKHSKHIECVRLWIYLRRLVKYTSLWWFSFYNVVHCTIVIVIGTRIEVCANTLKKCLQWQTTLWKKIVQLLMLLLFVHRNVLVVI